jgi:hypothetical protein
MPNYSLYTQSGAQLKKIPSTSDRKKFATLDEAVKYAIIWLTGKLPWRNHSRLDLDLDAQVLVMEYTGQYKCKIVAIIGKDSVRNIKVDYPEKMEEKSEEISGELSKENIEKFREKYCRVCGTQRCTGGGEWIGSCENFKRVFGEIPVEKLQEYL